jgi:hypothetical protein
MHSGMQGILEIRLIMQQVDPATQRTNMLGGAAAWVAALGVVRRAATLSCGGDAEFHLDCRCSARNCTDFPSL